jgi:hypothetical protein
MKGYKRRRRSIALPRYDGLVHHFPLLTQHGRGYFRPWRGLPTVAGKFLPLNTTKRRKRR